MIDPFSSLKRVVSTWALPKQNAVSKMVAPDEPSETVQLSGVMRNRPTVNTNTSHLFRTACVGGLGVLAVAISRTGRLVEETSRGLGLTNGPVGTVQVDKARPLPPSLMGDRPNSKMSRPMIFVPGFQTPKDRFDHMTEKLTQNGLNGGKVYYIKDDRVYGDQDCRQELRHVDPEARVFVAVFSSTKDSPPIAAHQLKHSLDRINKISGQKVDVAAYSMGGLATRTYLDRGGDNVGKLMMVGTPQHGSALAALSLGALNMQAAGSDVGWLLSKCPKAIDQDDRSALSWLSTEDGQDNEAMVGINSRWTQQRARLEDVLIVGSGEQHTFGLNFQFSKGDATVPVESLAIDDSTPVVLLKDKSRGTHGLLFSNPNLYDEMTRFFNWDKAD